MKAFVVLSVMSVSMFVTSASLAASKAAQARSNIDGLITSTWHYQDVMGARRTRTNRSYRRDESLPYLRWVYRHWKGVNYQVQHQFQNPPHKHEFLCIHHFEGSWTDTGEPYYGGLQMDKGFQQSYGAKLYVTKGTADHWSPLEQIWTAERALVTRGWWPWPNTARDCGLL